MEKLREARRRCFHWQSGHLFNCPRGSGCIRTDRKPLARILPALLVLAWVIPTVAADPPSAPSSPAPAPAQGPQPAEPAVPIFLESPASLDAFLARIQSPDFVLLRGDRYQSLLKATTPANATKPTAPAPSIARVTIKGQAGSKTARLAAEFEVFNDDAQPRWVALRLDGLPVGRVSERGQLLQVRNGVGGGAWEAEVTGAGRHVVDVEFTAAVVTNGEERRLDLAIPLAATTAVDLTLEESAIDAALGGHDPVTVQKSAGQKTGGKIAVSMTPRNRLDLTWRVPLEQSMLLPPLLSAQGELAVDVTAEAIRTRARWSITAVRGTTRSLQFTLDADEDLIDLELDGRSLAVDTVTKAPNRYFVIDLPDPLRQGSLGATVTFNTRRKLSARNGANVSMKGYPIAGATLQTGAISLTQNGSIWVDGSVVRGLTRIDPAEDLPAELRSRPGTTLAYRFVEQPFELSLKVDSAPPSLESRNRSLVTALPDQVTIESEFQFRATPGQTFNVRFHVPVNVTLDTVAADENIESAKLGMDPTPERGFTPIAKRLLNVRLTPHARDLGVFRIKLVTHQRWSRSTRTLLGLIEPDRTASLGGRIAIRRAVGIDADLAEVAAKAPVEPQFLRALPPAAGDWTLSSTATPGIESTLTWLTYDGNPDTLPLRLAQQKRDIRSHSEVKARVTRTGIDYRSSVSLEVVNGLLSEFDVLVPPGVDRSWEVEGVEIARREPASALPDGRRRYTLTLAKPDVKRIDLRFRYRTTFDAPIPSDKAFAGRFETLRVQPMGEGNTRFAFEAEPGLKVEMKPAGWSQQLAPSGASDASNEIAAGSLAYVASNSESLPEFSVRAEPLVGLPSLVIGRALLSTSVGNDELRTTATLRFESHGRDVVVALPPESRWIQAQVNGQALTDVEKVGEGTQYRVLLPSDGGVILAIDYATPARSKSAWEPPAVESAIWQTTYWNVSVPNTVAILGVPTGWTDQNEWAWDRFVWIRRPVMSVDELRAWFSGTARKRANDEPPAVGTGHAYLFRRTEGPARMPVMTVSRVLLLAICSGSVGLFGILLVIARPALRSLIIPAAMAVFIVAVGWDPNITFQVVQSGMLGATLAGIALVLQRVIDRRSGGRPRVIESSGSHTQGPQRTTSLVHTPISDDESTAIRTRPLSNDRILIGPPPSAVEPPPKSASPTTETGHES